MDAWARQFSSAAAVVLALVLSACGTVRVEGGAPFDPGRLESDLKPGISTEADLRAALGEPYGKGGAMLPFHDRARTTWTYFYERGTVDLGKGGMSDERIYLFVFLADGRYDSYMWFTSSLAPAKK